MWHTRDCNRLVLIRVRDSLMNPQQQHGGPPPPFQFPGDVYDVPGVHQQQPPSYIDEHGEPGRHVHFADQHDAAVYGEQNHGDHSPEAFYDPTSYSQAGPPDFGGPQYRFHFQYPPTHGQYAHGQPAVITNPVYDTYPANPNYGAPAHS